MSIISTTIAVFISTALLSAAAHILIRHRSDLLGYFGFSTCLFVIFMAWLSS